MHIKFTTDLNNYFLYMSLLCNEREREKRDSSELKLIIILYN